MPRLPRHTYPGLLHHVICRFVDRRWLLKSNGEREQYLRLLGRALGKSDWRCVAYCLMSNHLHFGLIGGHMPADSWTRKVNSPFARWLNSRHERLGPVFADRPSIYAVTPDNAG